VLNAAPWNPASRRINYNIYYIIQGASPRTYPTIKTPSARDCMPHSHSHPSKPLLYTNVLLSDSPIQNGNYVILYILPTYYIVVLSVSDAKQTMGPWWELSGMSYRVSHLRTRPTIKSPSIHHITPLSSSNILL